jgi:hypothetical protein
MKHDWVRMRKEYYESFLRYLKSLQFTQNSPSSFPIPMQRNHSWETSHSERWDGMGWINLAQDMGQWKAVVNMVMNFRVS